MSKLVIGSGIVAFVFASLYLGFPTLLTAAVRSQLTLTNPEIFGKWVKPPIAIDYMFHFFEVLNPREAIAGAKVNLREKGPYRFR